MSRQGMDSRRCGGGNRMMTSSTLTTNDMWSKTIGYDPHAAASASDAPAETAEDAARKAERERGVMELARLETINQGGGSRGDKFAQNLFWGLKRKAPPRGYEVAPLESSSSSSGDSSSDSSDGEAPAKRARADADRDARRLRKKAKKEAKKEAKKKRKKEKECEKKDKKEKKRKKEKKKA